MPVRVTFRVAVFGQGYVAQFRNTSKRFLAVSVVLENQTTRHKREGYIEMAPGGQTEVGWLQGWKFVSGETIAMSHQDYQDARVRVS